MSKAKTVVLNFDEVGTSTAEERAAMESMPMLRLERLFDEEEDQDVINKLLSRRFYD